jgi:diacylglycerol kinase (ATP)
MRKTTLYKVIIKVNNKPKYHIFKNTKYALDGFWYVLKTETSFKIELIIALFVLPIMFFTPFELWQQITLLITYFIILIVELLNSAIENTVDLITKEIHPLAKSAKDIGATAVMFSIALHIICWFVFLITYV